MSVVIVLTPNGRRQNVKITPNTTLLQILEEVCSKHGFKPEDYDIRHHNKILDVSSIFRYTGLPNNALLEMTEARKQRSESSVVLALHLETGERLTGEFIPSENLWDVILSLNPEAKAIPNPVVIYMRKEVCGKENLEKTNLRSLGLTGGRAILRLFNRTPEELRTQANVSAQLVRNTETSESSDEKKDSGPVDPKVKEKQTSVPNKTQKSPEKEVPLQEKEKKPESSPRPARKNEGRPNELGKIIEMCKDKKMEQENAKGSVSIKKESVAKESEKSESKNISEKPMSNTVENSSLKKVEHAVKEPDKGSDVVQNNAILLGDRNAVAYTLNKVKPVTFEEEPDDFYELTVSDAKLLLKSAKQLCVELENAPLMTAAQRELEKNKKILSLLNQYKKTVLRVKFPDKTVLQGTFSSVEKVSEVKKFVAGYLENPDTPFYLYTTPPKEILKWDDNLLESNCVPCAVIYFGVNSDTNRSNGKFLRSDILEKFSSPSAAALMACQSRGLKPNQIPEEKEPDDEEENVEDDSDAVAGPSTSSSSSQGKPQREQESSPPLKVPKKFKMKK